MQCDECHPTTVCGDIVCLDCGYVFGADVGNDDPRLARKDLLTHVDTSAPYSATKGSTYNPLFHFNERLAQLDCKDPVMPEDLLMEITKRTSAEFDKIQKECGDMLVTEFCTREYLERILKSIMGKCYYIIPLEDSQDFFMKPVKTWFLCCHQNSLHQMEGCSRRGNKVYVGKRCKESTILECCKEKEEERCKCVPAAKEWLERWIRIRYELTGLKPPEMGEDLRREFQKMFYTVMRSWDRVRHHPQCSGKNGESCHHNSTFKCRHNISNYGFVMMQFVSHLIHTHPNDQNLVDKLVLYFWYLKTLKTKERINYLKMKWMEMYPYSQIPLYPIPGDQDFAFSSSS